MLVDVIHSKDLTRKKSSVQDGIMANLGTEWGQAGFPMVEADIPLFIDLNDSL